MRIARACDALEKGCCLELCYRGFSRLAEVHAVGFDDQDRAVLLAWLPAAGNARDAPGWRLLYLDETRKVAVSGIFSEAPRPGYAPDDSRIAKAVCQLSYEGELISTAWSKGTVMANVPAAS